MQSKHTALSPANPQYSVQIELHRHQRGEEKERRGKVDLIELLYTHSAISSPCFFFPEAMRICGVLWMIYLLYFTVGMLGCFWIIKLFIRVLIT